jgi:hypothetical protein
VASFNGRRKSSPPPALVSTRQNDCYLDGHILAQLF